MTVEQVIVPLTRQVCCCCGVVFAIPTELDNRLRNNHNRFYCPNGHGQSYIGETEAQKLKRQLQQKENELAQKITANIQLDNQLTQLKKDIAAGKCPCCKKVYKHLAKHMANKHPQVRQLK